jgi:hypothetical protein
VVYIQALYRMTRVCQTGWTVSRGCRQLSTVLPTSSGLGSEEKRSEVRGPTSWPVPTDGTGTVPVEAAKAPQVPCVKKPPRRVEK